jgi:hypothetical protein
VQVSHPRALSRPSKAILLAGSVATALLSGLTPSADAAVVSQPIAWKEFATGTAGTVDPNNAAVGAAASNMQSALDKNNPKISGSVVDAANNRLYVSTNVGLDRGSVTILDATTGALIQKVDTTGGVSQMVVAGDGKVYGVVNQRTSTSTQTSGQAYRVIQFGTSNQTTYSVNTIWQPSNIGLSNTAIPIVGLGLNPASQNPIWTLTGTDNTSKNQEGWEYNTSTATSSLQTIGNTGFSLNRGGYPNATAVGLNANGKPVVGFYGNSGAATDGLVFDTTPNPSINGGEIITGSPGFINNSITSSSYSVAKNNYWAGYSGSSGSTIIALRNGTDNPGGNTATAGVYANSGTTSFFHALPEGGAFSGGGNYMVGTMLPDLAGNVYYSVIARPDGTYISGGGLGAGKVLQIDSSGTYYDDGVPTIASGRTGSILNSEQVVSIASAPGVAPGSLNLYAVTLDTLGQYRVYSTLPEPASLSLLGIGGVLALGRNRRRRGA